MLKDLCFEVIQACPNECKFCSSKSSKDKDTIITLETFKRTVTYFIENGGIGEISISGGEPFLHPDLFKMVEFCKSKGIRTVVFTSGIKRREQVSEDIAKEINSRREEALREIERFEPWNERLKQNTNSYYDYYLNPGEFTSITREEFEYLKFLGLDKIVFDWQALDEDIDNDLMGRKRTNTLMMDSLIRAKNAGLDVDVHFIPMKKNYKEFPDIIECLEIAGVKNISVLNFVPQGRGRVYRDELMLSPDELKEFSGILKREKEHFSGKIRIGIPLNGKMSHLCTAGTEKLVIRYDGVILPCPAFKEISMEKMEKYGIEFHSIYTDLEKVIVPGGSHDRPLCRQVYGFNGDLSDIE